jgi:hypothetical protein
MPFGSLSPRRIRRGVVLSTGLTLVLLLISLNEDEERCEQECFGTYRTYEPGHAWTNYQDSWQWDAQNAIAAVGFILAVAGALSLVGDHLRRAVVLTVLSWGCSAAWLLWNALSPAVGT